MLTGLIIGAALIAICVTVMVLRSGPHRPREESNRNECPACGRTFASVRDFEGHLAAHLEVRRPTLTG